MTNKRDWDVITGWEKRIKVDYGSIGPNHVRWSHWTFKERDIVARKIHEITLINETEGNRSRAAEDWRRENEPILIDFARDHKPMPDWAHADYRESGVPEYVKVVWDQPDTAGPGEFAYDPPGPWEAGEEPEWSSKPKDTDYNPEEIVGLETKGKMDPKFNNVVSYKVRPNGDHVATDGTIISTKENRAKEDVPQWKKFELGRLEIFDNVVIPGPNALPKDEEQYGKNRELTNIHKTRPKPAKQEDCIEIGELEWNGGRLLLPVSILSYPENRDELLCAAKSRDCSRGGWVGCRASEAMGSGASHVETVRNADQINFVVPLSYFIQSKLEDDPEFRLNFRKSNERSKPEFIYAVRKCPPQYETEQTETVILSEPQRLFMEYAMEDFRPFAHQVKWARVLLATGYKPSGELGRQMEAVFRAAEKTGPIDYKECLELYEQHNRNERWTQVKDWFENAVDIDTALEAGEKRLQELNEYENSPPIQGNYSIADWEKSYNGPPVIANVLSEFGSGNYIVDPQARVPLWKIDGPQGQATETWGWNKAEGWVNIDKPVQGQEILIKPEEADAVITEHAEIIANEQDPIVIKALLLELIESLNKTC